MPGEDLELEQGTEQNVEDESLQEDQEPDGEEIEGQVSGTEDGEDPDATDDEGQIDPAPRRPNRAQSRIQALNDSLRQERERAAKVERELEEIRAAERRRAQQPQGESQEARAARRALMDPVDRLAEDLRESEERTRQLLHQNAMQQREVSDKQTYDAVLRDNPGYKRFDAEVEKIRKEQADNGAFVPREVILDLVIGRAARAQAAKKAPKAKAEGQRQIERQRTAPARTGGDTQTARGRQGDSLEKRLADIPL